MININKEMKIAMAIIQCLKNNQKPMTANELNGLLDHELKTSADFIKKIGRKLKEAGFISINQGVMDLAKKSNKINMYQICTIFKKQEQVFYFANIQEEIISILQKTEI